MQYSKTKFTRFVKKINFEIKLVKLTLKKIDIKFVKILFTNYIFFFAPKHVTKNYWDDHQRCCAVDELLFP